MNRIDAEIAIARNLRDLIVDAQPVSLTGSTMQFNELIHPLYHPLIGKHAYIYSGAGAGQERVVGSFNPTLNETIFPQVFGSVPSTNSNVMITDHFAKQEYDNVLDRMVGAARLRYLEEVVATLELVGSQYEYLVPSGFQYISNIRLVPSGNSDYEADDEVDRIFELSSRFWNIEANAGGSFLIVIDPRKVSIADALDKEWSKVMGQAKPDIAGTDNATIPEDLEEYLINGASMLLASQRINENKEWSEKFRMFRDLHRGLEEYIHRQRYGRRVGA